jgi:hypothetical protein
VLRARALQRAAMTGQRRRKLFVPRSDARLGSGMLSRRRIAGAEHDAWCRTAILERAKSSHSRTLLHLRRCARAPADLAAYSTLVATAARDFVVEWRRLVQGRPVHTPPTKASSARATGPFLPARNRAIAGDLAYLATSRQFGRTSAPIALHFVQTIFGPKDGTVR